MVTKMRKSRPYAAHVCTDRVRGGCECMCLFSSACQDGMIQCQRSRAEPPHCTVSAFHVSNAAVRKGARRGFAEGEVVLSCRLSGKMLRHTRPRGQVGC